MRKKKLVIGLGGLLTTFVLTMTTLTVLASDVNSVKYSKYLNVAQNSTYDKDVTIMTLKDTSVVADYLKPVESEYYTKTTEQIGDYGYYVNGQYHFDEATTLTDDGTYRIEVTKFIYDSKNNVYFSNDDLILESFYITIDKEYSYVTPISTTFIFESYDSAEYFINDVISNLKLDDSYKLKFTYELEKFYNGFNQDNNEGEEHSLVLDNGQEITINLYSNKSTVIDTKFVTKNASGELDPIIIDLAYHKNCIGAKVSEKVNVFYDLDKQFIIGKHNAIVSGELISDLTITGKDQVGKLSYSIKTSAFRTPITFERTVNVINSLQRDTYAPVLTFEDMTVKSVQEIWDNLYTDVEVFDYIDTSTSKKVKNYYSLDIPDGTYYGITTDAEDVLKNKKIPGVYKITYKVKDTSGNETTRVRNFTVEDTAAPITLTKYNLIVLKKDDYNNFMIDDYILIVDNCDEAPTRTINYKETGNNMYTYYITAKDSSGNESTTEVYVYLQEDKGFYKEKVEPFFWKIKKIFVKK